MMKLKWVKKDFNDDIEFILFHQQDNTPNWWRRALFNAYPDLDMEYAKSLNQQARNKYLTQEMQKISVNNAKEFQHAIDVFQQEWNNKADKLNSAFSSAFDNDCADILNNMQAEVGLNPICPRDVHNYTFSVYYRMLPKWAIATALHEMTHFVWFYFWQKHFHDNPNDYDNPHLKWLLSEIVVETIIRNSEIGTIGENPKHIAYSYFYDMEINGCPIFDVMREMYLDRKNIFDFMEQSFKWISDNEQELRNKISIAEQ